MELSSFLAQQKIVILDGAMGTQLAAAGYPMGGQNNLTNPDAVLAIHRAYAQAGCDLLITNTLTMNRIYLETHRVEVDVKEVNLAGARLARAAVNGGQYVLGDLCSTGQLLEPYGDYTEGQFTDAYKEQAAYLAEGGVDGFIIETMLDLREALCAVRACRAVAQALPILVSLGFHTTEQQGRTIMGNSAAESAMALVAAGADAVGANCCDLDPFQTAEIVSYMKAAVSVPIIAQPNAGRPKLEAGVTLFDMTPTVFAEGIASCLQAGATMVGGCCGTTPEHIRRIAEMRSYK